MIKKYQERYIAFRVETMRGAASTAGFEPARGNPSRFRVCRLNHSAKLTDYPDHAGDRTQNLVLRRHAPYPLGHTVQCVPIFSNYCNINRNFEHRSGPERVRKVHMQCLRHLERSITNGLGNRRV